MPTCFVMQPFDGGPFDQRYEEVYAPAIRAADLVPYRVDQDPGVSIPIQDIERGIQQSRICLAEITQDNPNVWFELGFAIASRKEVVLICSDARTTKFPFDVQHRTIIRYATGSPSDFETLKINITQKLCAYMEKSDTLANVTEITQLAATSGGFGDHEIVALAAVAQSIEHTEDHATASQVQRDMEAAGFTRIAATFALKLLVQKGYLSAEAQEDFNNNTYYGYSLTPQGWAWMLANQDRFALRKPKSKSKSKSQGFDDMDDDIPF